MHNLTEKSVALHDFSLMRPAQCFGIITRNHESVVSQQLNLWSLQTKKLRNACNEN